jgi:hypothetical protein
MSTMYCRLAVSLGNLAESVAAAWRRSLPTTSALPDVEIFSRLVSRRREEESNPFQEGPYGGAALRNDLLRVGVHRTAFKSLMAQLSLVAHICTHAETTITTGVHLLLGWDFRSELTRFERSEGRAGTATTPLAALGACQPAAQFVRMPRRRSQPNWNERDLWAWKMLRLFWARRTACHTRLEMIHSKLAVREARVICDLRSGFFCWQAPRVFS